MTDLKLEVGNAAYLRAASSYIRMQVFVLERSLALEAEFDQKDTPDTIYSVVFAGSLPVATARLLRESEETARIGRVATLKAYRGKELDSRAVKALETLAEKKRFKQIVIHAELTASKFYEQLGYLKVGKTYEEDGVSCITLNKKL